MRLLVLHSDRSARKFLEKRAGNQHLVKTVGNLAKAVREIIPYRPDMIIAEIDTRKSAALDLLRYLKRNRIRLPVVLVGEAGAGILQPAAMKMGASAFVEYPMEEQALARALARARRTFRELNDRMPEITPEELDSNLSELEQRLNDQMVCFAGRNQVYIQSLITDVGTTTKPRITLKCPIRKDFGYPPNVYYEFIRDVCCGNPSACPAYQEFTARKAS